MNFRAPMVDLSNVLWRPTTDKYQRPTTPTPEHDDDDMARKHHAEDSDNDTESADSVNHPQSTHHQHPPPLHPEKGGVASAIGKLLPAWGRQRSLGSKTTAPPPPPPPIPRTHARTVSDFSESDFLAPFTTGTLVSTRYGLGTVGATREDGITVIHFQGPSAMTLFMASRDDECFAIPAIRHDWVETPSGEGRVVAFDPRTQVYTVQIGGDFEYICHVARHDVRRCVPTRKASGQFASPATIHKGLTSALKSIVSTSTGILSSTTTYQFVSNCYYQGQCVVTTFGAGQIVSFDQTNQRVQVQLVWGALAYLSATAILYYTKALVGMEVHTTRFGSGIVTDVRPADEMYTVRLHTVKPGENEVVYVHESDLTRGRRIRLASAPSQVKATTNKLFSFAQSTVKRFGPTSKAPAARTPPPATDVPPSNAKLTRTTSNSSSNKTNQELHEEPSSAGI